MDLARTLRTGHTVSRKSLWSRKSIGIWRQRIIDQLSTLGCAAALILVAVPAGGEDWGMGAANRQIARGAVFSPVSTPAGEIATLGWFVLAVTAAILLVVFGLLLYSVVRFR